MVIQELCFPWKLYWFIISPSQHNVKDTALWCRHNCIAQNMLHKLSDEEGSYFMEEESVPDIYKVDILCFMQAVKQLWNFMDSTIISTCYNNTSLIKSPKVDDLTGPDEWKALTSALQQPVTTFARMDIKNMLNPQNEDDYFTKTSHSALIEQILKP